MSESTRKGQNVRQLITQIRQKVFQKGAFPAVIIYLERMVTIMKRFYTAESVTEGHPDKICDQISDAIVDAIMAEDPQGRVAAETTVNTGYAMIMGEIKRYLRDNQVIRVSRHLKDLAYKAFRLKEEYMHEHQKEPSVKWLAKQLEVKEKDIVDALDSTQSVISIFEPVYNGDGDELYLLDQIKDDKDEVEHLNNLMALKRSLAQLRGKEKEIIEKRYYQDKTQMEIANELGISQAQVSRLEKNAIAQLKKEFES